MAFIRQCLVNVRNIKIYRKLCVLKQNGTLSSNFSICSTDNSIKYASARNRLKWRKLHTSHFLNKTVAFTLSDIGEGIREVVIKEWFVKIGDKVQQFDNICEVQSDKAAVTISSRYDGVITRLYHEVNQTALVGQPLVDIEVQDNEDDAGFLSKPDTPTAIEAVSTTSETTGNRVKVLTTPAVRRIAAQFKVDLNTVSATGRNGRILKEDLLAHLNISADKSNEIPNATTTQAGTTPCTSAEMPTEILEDRIVPVTGFTKAMVKSMTESIKIPHFGLSDEYNVTKLVEARDHLKILGREHGIKITYMPIIIKAASLSLRAYPILNSSLDSTCENIMYKSSHNIGVAMDTPNGLIVPVIKNVQSKTILDIARELNVIQEKGKKSQLGLHDVTGGTFTLSNIGIVGGTYTNPKILAPQVAIGAIGKIKILPRFDSEGNVIKAHILSVSWSADHRVVDGVTMARFSNQLKKYLENPYTLLLDL